MKNELVIKMTYLSGGRNNNDRYSCLSRMACDFLSIPATSVPAERLFSKAALFIRKHRNKLNNDSARSQLCLQS